MNLRTTVTVQGIVLLGLASYTLKYDTDTYFNLALLFGFLFTWVLKQQQLNYLADFDAHVKYIDKLEGKLITDDDEARPWTNYKKELTSRKNNNPKWYPNRFPKCFPESCTKYFPKYFPFFIQSGPFNFFMFVFLFLFFVNIFGLMPPVVEK